MPFVVDASLAGSWFLPDESSAVATGLARRLIEGGAAAPSLFWHEVRNLLLSARRALRLDDAAAGEQIAALEALPILDAGRGDGPAVLRLGLKHRLTAYDAAYLALAIERRLPLATLDRRLREAAKAEGVVVLPDTP